MMNFEAIVQRLEDAGLGKAGENLFISFMPDGMPGILLRPYPGGVSIDHYLPGFRKDKFMMIVRGSDYVETRELAEAAVKAITVVQRTTLGGSLFQYMRPKHDPFSFPHSKGQLIEFLVNIDCCYC